MSEDGPRNPNVVYMQEWKEGTNAERQKFVKITQHQLAYLGETEQLLVDQISQTNDPESKAHLEERLKALQDHIEKGMFLVSKADVTRSELEDYLKIDWQKS